MSKTLKIIFTMIVVADIAVWFLISHPLSTDATQLYFLDVGQGDSSLAILPGGVKVLIDGGPMNGRLQKNLENILPLNDRYIDLIMISHAQLDHFGGLMDVLRTYRVGAVLMSEYGSESKYWKEFERLRIAQKIPKVIVNEGDRIVYGDSQFIILSPGHGVRVKDLNEVAIGTILESNDTRTFFGGDIGAIQEQAIARSYDIDVDILKVSHHGSKFSSDPIFLKEASPEFAMIEVGKNSYGHPTKEALGRLMNSGAKTFRTDLSGFIKVMVENGKLQVYTQK